MALRSKIALITGASSGIGAGIAEQFAKEGAKLSLTGRNKNNLVAVAKTCQDYSSEDVITTVGDITKEHIRQEFVQKTKDYFRKIDILMNNAGIFKLGPLTEVTPELFDEQMDINVRTPVLLAALVAPHLIESKGCVLNMSSPVTTVTKAMPISKPWLWNVSAYHRLWSSRYDRRKPMLAPYVRCLFSDKDGTRYVYQSSCKSAGVVLTPIFGNVQEETARQHLESIRKNIPMGRLGTTEDVARMASFLVSDRASFITGENLLADGGTCLMPGF